jgi:prophage maintenance system killer protein
VRGVDEADLILIGATALDVDPEELVEQAEVDVLAAIAERTSTTPGPVEAAAEVLVGLAASRPFPFGNRAAAWLAAAHLLALNAINVEIDEGEARTLVRRAAVGEINEAETCAALMASVVKPAGNVRRAMHWLATPSRSTPRPANGTWTCPVCGRAAEIVIRPPGLRSYGSVVTPAMVIAACAHQHQAHDRYGSLPRQLARSYQPADRWIPVIRPTEPVAGDPFIVIAPSGAVAFMPTPPATTEHDSGPEPYEVIVLAELRPTDLLGSWESLPACGTVIGQVGHDAIRFDPTGRSVDWDRLLEGCGDMEDQLSPRTTVCEMQGPDITPERSGNDITPDAALLELTARIHRLRAELVPLPPLTLSSPRR